MVHHLNHVSANPFDVDEATGHLYLNPDAPDTGCIDAGGNGIADGALGAAAWRASTTRIDGQTETQVDGAGTEVVDLGAHYGAP